MINSRWSTRKTCQEWQGSNVNFNYPLLKLLQCRAVAGFELLNFFTNCLR